MVRVFLDCVIPDDRSPLYIYTYDVAGIYWRHDLNSGRQIRLVNGYWYVLEDAKHDTADPHGFYGGNSASGYLRWLLYGFKRCHWYVDVDDFIMAVDGGRVNWGSVGRGTSSTHVPCPQDIGRIMRTMEAARMMKNILQDGMISDFPPPTRRNSFTGRWSSFGADYAYDPQTGRVNRVTDDND